MWGTLELLDRQIGRDERPDVPGLVRSRWVEHYKQCLRMFDKMSDPELRGERKPRIRVKAGPRKLPA